MLIRLEQAVSTKGKKVVLSSEINIDLFHNKIEKPSKVVSQKKKMVWVPKISKDIKSESQTSVPSTTKSKKPKVTFKQLLAKYEKEKADKGSNRSNYFRHTKSFSRRYFDDYKHWQENEYTQMPYFPIEYMYRECPPKMPMSYEPYFACNPYSSYG